MSDSRQNVLDAVGILTQHLGYPPSVEEIARFCRTDKRTAHFHLTNLRAKGLVDNEDGKARTIHLTEAGRAQTRKVVVL